ncbi:MAG: hypothetical protein WD871_03045 [Xanthobacteraceae bacterium]
MKFAAFYIGAAVMRQAEGGAADERRMNSRLRAGSVQRGQFAYREKHRVKAMTIEVFAFFVIAASLVLVGFASGPVVARKLHSNPHRHLYR